MRLLWNLAMTLMLTLTGLSILLGLVLGHAVEAIVLRSTVVLVVSGMAVMGLSLWNMQEYRQARKIARRLKTAPKAPDANTREAA